MGCAPFKLKHQKSYNSDVCHIIDLQTNGEYLIADYIMHFFQPSNLYRSAVRGLRLNVANYLLGHHFTDDGVIYKQFIEAIEKCTFLPPKKRGLFGEKYRELHKVALSNQKLIPDKYNSRGPIEMLDLM